jgi:hypothetical protein
MSKTVIQNEQDKAQCNQEQKVTDATKYPINAAASVCIAESPPTISSSLFLEEINNVVNAIYSDCYNKSRSWPVSMLVSSRRLSLQERFKFVIDSLTNISANRPDLKSINNVLKIIENNSILLKDGWAKEYHSALLSLDTKSLAILTDQYIRVNELMYIALNNLIPSVVNSELTRYNPPHLVIVMTKEESDAKVVLFNKLKGWSKEYSQYINNMEKLQYGGVLEKYYPKNSDIEIDKEKDFRVPRNGTDGEYIEDKFRAHDFYTDPNNNTSKSKKYVMMKKGNYSKKMTKIDVWRANIDRFPSLLLLPRFTLKDEEHDEENGKNWGCTGYFWSNCFPHKITHLELFKGITIKKVPVFSILELSLQ